MAIQDILIINNLVAREQSVIEGNELRKWHVRNSGYVYTYYPELQKEVIINQAITFIQKNHRECLTAILWLMESWNTTLLETRLVLLRLTYEFLHRRIQQELDDFLNRLKVYVDSIPGSCLPTWWHPKKYLVIGRQCRNYVTHVGILVPDATNNGETVYQAIIRECNKPTPTWKDGCPELIQLVNTILTNSNGFEDLKVSCHLYLDLLLYLFFIDYIGLDFTKVDGFQDILIHYLTTLNWHFA